MTKPKLTQRRDESEKHHEPPRSRSRLARLAGFCLLVLMVGVALGNRGCDEQSATITCADLNVHVEPGTCRVFQNPCADGQWAHPHRPDGFVLAPTDEQRSLFGTEVSLRTTRNGDEIVRSVCTTADTPHFVEQPVPFLYMKSNGQFGRAHLILTVAPRVTVNATASPSTISIGDSSQLVASVSGGVAPYFYHWIPASGLDDQDIAAPIASPRVTTTYRVDVTDSSGLSGSSTVTIHVSERLTVTAAPQSIWPGELSQLEAIFEGGTPPYTYDWTPAGSLRCPPDEDCSSFPDPIARPRTTTTYTVTVTDATGVTLNGAVTVNVSGEPLSARASANPSSISSGETSQLDVEVTGGVAPYSYSWNESNPTNSLSDRLIRNPVASPTDSTFYEVTVRDANGSTVSNNVMVTVVGPPPPTASFFFNVLCCPTLHLDASASTGEIATYTWDLGWTTASPDLVTSSPTASFVIQEFNRGTIRLTVTDTAGRTATVSQNF